VLFKPKVFDGNQQGEIIKTDFLILDNKRSNYQKEMISRTRWGGDFSLTLSISHKKEGSGQHEGVRQRSAPQDFSTTHSFGRRLFPSP
jgi:hypothetical protein